MSPDRLHRYYLDARPFPVRTLRSNPGTLLVNWVQEMMASPSRHPLTMLHPRVYKSLRLQGLSTFSQRLMKAQPVQD
jgi:hypothetical protein